MRCSTLTSLAICFAAASFSRDASAQTAPPTVVVRVHVVDSAGVPVPNANLVIRRQLSTIVGTAATDARGNGSVAIPRTGAENDLVVRKIGFVRAERFFNDTSGDLRFEIRVARSVIALDTVTVVEREDPTRKSYFIDAEQIENSPRFLADGMDIVTKLRTDMVWGRQGRPDGISQHGSKVIDSHENVHLTPGRNPALTGPLLKNAHDYGYCPPVQNIWVNGQWVRYAEVRPDVALRIPISMPLRADIATVLATIRPEHIAEMQYYPCTAKMDSVTAHSTNAIYVRLKPGIGYFPDVGSYVSALGVPVRPRTVVSVANRIVGVFDDATGEALDGVSIVDISTGTKALTTKTGTVGLGFLAPGEQTIRIEKDGFMPQTLAVTMSPADTGAITIVLARAGK